MSLEGMDGIQANLALMVARMRAQAEAAGDETAKYLASYAKATPSPPSWTDRTSNLRNSIKGGSNSDGSTVRIVISESMVYAPFVELGHFAKRNTTRMSTRKGRVTAQRIRDRAYGTAVPAYATLWPAVAANTGTALEIFRRHLQL